MWFETREDALLTTRDHAGLNPACASAARLSSDASALRNACTAGRSFRALTSAKS
jgi:hypothetical protein